jgi:Protein of unknown function (DUF1236)
MSFVGFPEEDTMIKARLLSSVAAALLLSAGVASAQDMKKEGAAPAPAAQQSAPAEKVAPNMKAGDKNAETHKPAETTGQAPNASDAGKAGVSDKGAMDKGAATKSDADVKSKSAADTKSPDSKAGATKASSESKTNENTAQKAPDAKASPSATTGQGAAAGSAKLSTEQRTKITTVIRSQKVERVDASKLNISISVGARIPDRGVHFYPLPQEVFVIYPQWRGYDYILVGDQILVVDPRSREIVAILEA